MKTGERQRCPSGFESQPLRQFLISAGARSRVERFLWMKSERSNILFTSIVRRSRSNLSLPAASFNSPTNRIRTGAKRLGKKIKLARIELDLTQTQFAQKSMPSIGFCIFFFGKRVIITHGFSKKSDRIPVGEIERAERSMRDFLQRHERGEIEL